MSDERLEIRGMGCVVRGLWGGVWGVVRDEELRDWGQVSRVTV